MGCVELKSRAHRKREVIKGNILKMQHEQKENNQVNINQAHLRRIECEVDPLMPYTDFAPDTIKELSKEMSKIIIETQEGKKTGTGFFLSIQIDLELFDCLITNDHIINNESINNNNIIYVYYEGFKAANIILDKNKRYIRSFKDEKLDITVVEILDEDNMSKKYFLEPELDIPLNNNLINKEIYIYQYIEKMKLKNAEGIIKDISKYEISHTANTKKGSSGSPIFLKNSNKVIGIHKEAAPTIKINYGDFIYPIINIIKEDIRKKSNNGKYINGKYIFEDGKYYIGEFKNNMPNGKGIKYYKNGKIQYDGNFINGKFEGNGKYIYEDNDYYIGQFKNGLRNGKGIVYYSNGNIMYEGDFVNNLREGNGKYIYENGEYYTGQFKNGLSHGKGTEYYSNGNIKYEGDWINDKREGNGKYIYKSGEYYEGQWKNGLRHGKGKIYYSNGNIIY